MLAVLPSVGEVVVNYGPYAAFLAGGVVLERLLGIVSLIKNLLFGGSAKLNELMADVKEIVDDLKGGRLSEVLDDLTELRKDLEELKNKPVEK